MADSGRGERARVFLDACVLYPQLVRALVLGAAEAGLFQPLWSPRVAAEWRIAAARNGGIAAEAVVDVELARMARTFPGGEVSGSADMEATLTLPDPADAHVVAAAVAGKARTILTFNMRDFPARKLAALGLAARHPDGFFWQMLSEDSGKMTRAVGQAFAEVGVDATQARAALKRARLPRFGKAWEARGA